MARKSGVKLRPAVVAIREQVKRQRDVTARHFAAAIRRLRKLEAIIRLSCPPGERFPPPPSGKRGRRRARR